MRKLPAYQAVRTLRRIVFVAPAAVHLDVEARDVEERWQEARVEGLDAVLDLSGLGIALPLAEM